MKRSSIACLALLVVSTTLALSSTVQANKAALATVTGSVRDSKGTPLAGAIISVLKDGAKEVIKQAVTGPDGKFRTRISPGRYNIRAIATGFNEVLFTAVDVRASQELIYRFNLEPVGSGRTLPERRRDREDVRWRLRSAQSRRSIFQVQEGDDETIKAITAAEAAQNENQVDDTAADSTSPEGRKSRTQGVVESFFAANTFSPGFFGTNFALATPASDKVDLILVGQTGT